MILKLKGFSIRAVCLVLCVPALSRAYGARAATDSHPPKEVIGFSDKEEHVEDQEEDSDIDDRFATEGYVGGYVALLQQSVPTIGLSGSIFIDDDLRFGADFSGGQSKGLYGDFKTQNASVWSSVEISDSLWFKSGLSYTSLEKSSSQDPLSVLAKGADEKLTKSEHRIDVLGLDFSLGQLWSRPDYSIYVDYIGFTLPAMQLTGSDKPLFALSAGRVELLYNLD